MMQVERQAPGGQGWISLLDDEILLKFLYVEGFVDTGGQTDRK
jgi:hypothetical protein